MITLDNFENFVPSGMKETEFSNYFSFGGNVQADIYVKEQDSPLYKIKNEKYLSSVTNCVLICRL